MTSHLDVPIERITECLSLNEAILAMESIVRTSITQLICDVIECAKLQIIFDKIQRIMALIHSRLFTMNGIE